jgi:hypothetical protein
MAHQNIGDHVVSDQHIHAMNLLKWEQAKASDVQYASD